MVSVNSLNAGKRLVLGGQGAVIYKDVGTPSETVLIRSGDTNNGYEIWGNGRISLWGYIAQPTNSYPDDVPHTFNLPISIPGAKLLTYYSTPNLGYYNAVTPIPGFSYWDSHAGGGAGTARWAYQSHTDSTITVKSSWSDLNWFKYQMELWVPRTSALDFVT